MRAGDELSVTSHSIEIGGEKLAYTAKVGYLILPDEKASRGRTSSTSPTCATGSRTRRHGP
jgi:hypothetical protein